MSAGTITLTHNSAAVTGSGTAFTTDLKAGDIIVSVVGGVTYTLPVKTVNSATGVTLLKNYDGPTQAGAAWSAVPRDTMNAITAQLAAETAQALRGLNYDKQNWQQVFSGTGTITVRLPDGSSYTGPAWLSLTNALNEKANKKDLGSAAYQNAKVEEQTPADGLLSVGQYGIGGRTAVGSLLINSFGTLNRSGIYAAGGASSVGFYDAYQPVLFMSRVAGASLSAMQIGPRGAATNCFPTAAIGWQGWKECWGEGNTTIDSNGFIKKASPIIKIFHDGSFETNDESAGASVKREGVGIYRISNILGMNSDGTWGGIDGGFEIPIDRNGQRLLWLDYKVEADGSILVKTYHRTYPDAPVFARNIKEGYEEGDLIDIPSDQFVSVRVEMPQDSIWNLAQKAAQEEMEQEKTTEE